MRGFKVLSALVGLSVVLAKPSIVDTVAQLEKSNPPMLKYPTQLTQNIMPYFIHSHNDYWRDVPLSEAISLGVSSVEADVWYNPDSGDDTIYIGHESNALSKDRTLDSLYLGPLMQYLDQQNAKNTIAAKLNVTQGIVGIFDTDGGRTLQLLVDVKINGAQLTPALDKVLKPFADKNYLTKFENGVLTPGPVTVVGTGGTDLSYVLAHDNPRFIFYDAPLLNLTTGPAPNVSWSPEISPVASCDYQAAVTWNGIGNISAEDQQTIDNLVSEAHKLGIKSRFWDTPATPVYARDNVWRVLQASGSDWTNADDLPAATQF